MIKHTVFLFTLFSVLILFSCQPGNVTIFVSPDGDNLNPGTKKLPVQTIPQAQQLIREKKAAFPGSDIQVLFREGVYALEKPIIVTSDEGGGDDYSVSYSAFDDESVVISGGKEIHNWIVENGIWKSSVADVKDIQQLYINGQRATRARIPNLDEDQKRWYLVSVRIVSKQNENGFLQVDLWIRDNKALQEFSNLSDFEIIIFKDWATFRKQVTAYDAQTGWIMLSSPFAIFDGNYNGLLAPYVNRFTCYLEGHPDFIDQPGEWAYDKNEGVLYVTNGSRNIQIGEMILEDIGGNSVMIGTPYDPGSDNPALVQRVTFTNGRVNHGGRHYQSAVGIWLGFGTDMAVSNNEVFDHPYTGISVGWQWNPVLSSSRDNTISGNHIYDVMKMLGDGGGIYTLGFQPGSVHSLFRLGKRTKI